VSKVRFTRHAREDLLDIWLYIARQKSEAVADRVYDRIEETCRFLRDHRQLGPARAEIAEDARALVIERWLALYRLVDDGVQVVRVVDGSRDLAKIEWPLE
jgi:toxin ParE1/3/4